MRLPRLSALAACLLSLASISGEETHSPPKPRCFAHTVLDLERELGAEEKDHQSLDTLLVSLQEATHMSQRSKPEDIKEALRAMYASLKKDGFVYDTEGLPFYEALRNKKLCCQTGVYLYLGLADCSGIRVSSFLAPRHTALRFFIGEEVFNFETTCGEVFTDGDYVEQLHIAPTSTAQNVYLHDLTLDECKATIIVNIGAAYYLREDYTRAEHYFRKAVDLLPTFPTALINLSQCLVHKQETKEALTLLRHVLELDPHNSQALNTLGVINQGEGKLGEAKTCFEAALLYCPKNGEYQDNLALVESQIKQRERLEEQIQRFSAGFGN